MRAANRLPRKAAVGPAMPAANSATVRPTAPAANSTAPSAARSTNDHTLELLRERELLLSRLAQIDENLDAERDRRRKALTERYQKDLQQIEDEAAALGALGAPLPSAPTGGSNQQFGAQPSRGPPALNQVVAAAVSRIPHQDVAHQDVDIDVLMMSIDKDGDGVLTRAEVMDSASVSNSSWRPPARASAFAPALLGCTLSVLCYLALRGAYRHLMRPAGQAAAGREVATPRASADGGRNGGKRRKNAGGPATATMMQC